MGPFGSHDSTKLQLLIRQSGAQISLQKRLQIDNFNRKSKHRFFHPARIYSNTVSKLCFDIRVIVRPFGKGKALAIVGIELTRVSAPAQGPDR